MVMATKLESTTISLNPHSISQMKTPARYTTAWAAVLVIADILMFVAASYVAGALVDHNWEFSQGVFRFTHSSVIFVAIWLVIFCLLGLYRRSFALSFRDEFYFTVVALILGVMPQFVLFTSMPWLSTSRLVLLLSIVFAIILVGSMRSLLHAIRPLKKGGSRILIVGHGNAAHTLMQMLEKAAAFEAVLWAQDHDNREPLGGGAAHYIKKADELRCDRLVLTEMPPHENMYQWMGLARKNDVKLYVPLTPIPASAPILDGDGSREFAVPVPPAICLPVAKLAKRLMDVTLALPLLAIFAPVMLVAAIAILLESGYPVLYRQERIGRDGRTFNILKFRTMRRDADDKWAIPGDSRITKLGGVLRRTSIDELPQLLNVLAGDMSLVGPRPEMRLFEEQFAARIPSYAERRLALPGLTGWAQVNMKRNLTPDDASEVLQHDLFYIEHWSLFLDLTVLFKTAVEFLFQRAV